MNGILMNLRESSLSFEQLAREVMKSFELSEPLVDGEPMFVVRDAGASITCDVTVTYRKGYPIRVSFCTITRETHKTLNFSSTDTSIRYDINSAEKYPTPEVAVEELNLWLETALEIAVKRHAILRSTLDAFLAKKTTYVALRNAMKG